jgi:membrane protease YdiL (CAAX protease family)
MNMTIDSEFPSSVITISIVAIGLVVYWFTAYSEKAAAFFTKRYGEDKAVQYTIVYRRFMGLLFYVIVPSIVMFSILPQGLGHYGVVWDITAFDLKWMLGLTGIVLALQYWAARKPKNYDIYPNIRKNLWDRKLIFINTISWVMYLFSYEYLIRGLLLFGTVDELGVVLAVVINTVVYSLAHVPKGAREAYGAIPFGILMCYISLHSGNIWVAVWVHIVLALSNDYFAVLANPLMKFGKKKS